MASTFKLTPMRKIGNVAMTAALKLGVAPRGFHLMSVRGRASGRTYSTPVHLVERDEGPYLVSPYGERSWVKNVRAAGEVSMRRGRRTKTWRIEELSAADAAPVLAEYWQENAITRSYFDANLTQRPKRGL